MLYCLGDEANDILATTDITEDEKKVIYYRDPTSCFPIGMHPASKYGHHRRQKKGLRFCRDKVGRIFGVRKNIIFDWAKFNTRVQQQGESAEQFTSALYVLADKCNYIV